MSEDGRLDDIVASYLDAVDKGHEPDRDEILANNPDLADELRDFFRGSDELASATGAGPQAGAQLGPYELRRRLGAGGMGVVWEAYHKELDRTVALKTVSPHALDRQSSLERFYREARAVAALEHPGIVSLYDVGEWQGIPYLTMQLVGGGNLREHAENIASDPQGSARIVESLARAVHYAHLCGVVHRDLKPANVLLSESLEPRITDFGLARRSAGDATLTVSGAVLGTPSYMAPEQARGEMATEASDIYSLGVILYELLSGQRPFQRPTPLETLRSVAEEEPERPSAVRAGVPRDLETICLKCMEKEPRRRYADAGALADDLLRFRTGRPVEARRVSALGQVTRWCRRNPTAAALLAVLTASLVGALYAVDVIRERGQQAEVARGLSQESLRQAYYDGARLARRSSAAGRRFDSVEALANAAQIEPGLDLRNEAAASLLLFDLADGVDLPLVEGDTAAAVSPRLDRWASSNADGRITVHANGSVATRVVQEQGPRVRRLHFSSAGRYLCAGGERLRVWDLRADDVQAPIIDTQMANEQYGFDVHETRERAVAARSTGVVLVSLRERSERLVHLQSDWIGAVAFAPDGDRVAVALREVALRQWRVRVISHKGATLTSFECSDSARVLAWHPAGESLAVGSQRAVELWSLPQGRPTLQIAKDEVTAVAFHPAGTVVAVAGWDNRVRMVDVGRGDSYLTVAGNRAITFSGDGRHVAIVSNQPEATVHEIAPGAEFIRLRPATTRRLSELAVSVDGRRLAAGGVGADGATGSVAVFDVATRREVAQLETSARVGSVQFVSSTKSVLGLTRVGVVSWSSENFDSAEGLNRFPEPTALTHERIDVQDGVVRGQLDASGRWLAYQRSYRQGVAQRLDLASDRRTEASYRLLALTYLSHSPDGRWVAGGQRHGDGTARVWNAETGEVVHEVAMGSDSRSAFSPDSRRFVVGGLDEYRAFAVPTWKPLWTLKRTSLRSSPSFAFSPDGTLLATFDDIRTIRLVDPTTGAVLLALSTPDERILRSVAFGPGARFVAAVTQDDDIALWDLASLRASLTELGLHW